MENRKREKSRVLAVMAAGALGDSRIANQEGICQG